MDAYKFASEKKKELAPTVLSVNDGEAAPEPVVDNEGTKRGTSPDETKKPPFAKTVAAKHEGEVAPQPTFPDAKASKKLEKI